MTNQIKRIEPFFHIPCPGCKEPKWFSKTELINANFVGVFDCGRNFQLSNKDKDEISSINISSELNNVTYRNVGRENFDNHIKISIITTTKKRSELLKKCCKSIWEKAKDQSSIEHIVMYDDDDIETKDFLLQYKKDNLDKKINFYSVHNSNYAIRNLNKDYGNFAANMACGKYIFGLGDDCVITTNNYDDIISSSIEEYLLDKPDRICYVIINDDSKNHSGEYSAMGENEYSAFPIVTKEFVNIMGGICPHQIHAQGADIALYEIISKIEYDRILNLRHKNETITIEHWSPYTGRITNDDETHKTMYHGKSGLNEHEKDAYINKINEYIKRIFLKFSF